VATAAPESGADGHRWQLGSGVGAEVCAWPKAARFFRGCGGFGGNCGAGIWNRDGQRIGDVLAWCAGLVLALAASRKWEVR